MTEGEREMEKWRGERQTDRQTDRQKDRQREIIQQERHQSYKTTY